MKDTSKPPVGPKARSGVETYIVPDGSCFLFDPVSDATYTLDQLGALVWDFCDGQIPAEQIIHQIAELLPDDAAIPARTRRLLADFAEEGLLESAEVNTEIDVDDD